MKSLGLVLLVIASLAGFTSARNGLCPRFRLFELVAAADVIVSGTVRDLREGSDELQYPYFSSEGTFALDVEQRVAGAQLPEAIRVQRYRDSTCAFRWAPYAEGQRVLLFLAAPREASAPYTILGVRGEGEMPVVEQEVLLRGYLVKELERRQRSVDGATLKEASIALSDFKQAVVGFRASYALEKDKRGRRSPALRPDRSLDVAEADALSSPFAFYLHRQAAAFSVPWRGLATRQPR
jgi:hypothetical protein